MKRLLLAGAAAFSMIIGLSAGASARINQPLLQQAIEDTNVARTYLEVDSASEVTAKQTLTITAWEQYDEVHDRERDHASVVETGRGPGGKSQRYSVDIVMMDGQTFHRSSLDHKGWQVQVGYGYTDPASGQQWARTSLQFAFLSQLKLVSEGVAGGGQQRFRFRIPLQSPARGHAYADVWVRTGNQPYIVRYVETAEYLLRGQRVQMSVQSNLRDFNQPVHITAPKVGS